MSKEEKEGYIGVFPGIGAVKTKPISQTRVVTTKEMEKALRYACSIVPLSYEVYIAILARIREPVVTRADVKQLAERMVEYPSEHRIEEWLIKHKIEVKK